MFPNCFHISLDTSKKALFFNGKSYTFVRQNKFNKFSNFNILHLMHDPASHAGSRRFKSYSAHQFRKWNVERGKWDLHVPLFCFLDRRISYASADYGSFLVEGLKNPQIVLLAFINHCDNKIDKRFVISPVTILWTIQILRSQNRGDDGYDVSRL